MICSFFSNKTKPVGFSGSYNAYCHVTASILRMVLLSLVAWPMCLITLLHLALLCYCFIPPTILFWAPESTSYILSILPLFMTWDSYWCSLAVFSHSKCITVNGLISSIVLNAYYSGTLLKTEPLNKSEHDSSIALRLPNSSLVVQRCLKVGVIYL